ncbi:MAG: GntR family transcriptional regulator [Gammaproteobacteria bacterium]|nr:GntR family transcriptional regulator [Gammaproteobacteria bacterium]
MKRTAQALVRGPLFRAVQSSNALAHDAYEHLLTQLLEGDLKPNDWLSVVDLTVTLKCSRVPVMEAIKRLAGEGFVTVIPQIGCRVRMPNPDEVEDFFALFAAVEGCVTRLAAARRTTDDVIEFKASCATVDRLLKRAGGPAARDLTYRRLNLMFHTQIHTLARAPSACQIAASLWDRSDFYIKVAFGSLYFTKRVKQAHLAIRRAIIAGNAAAAGRAVESHLRAVGLAVSARLRSQAEPA